MEQINKINVNGVDYQLKDETVPIVDNEDISVVHDDELQKDVYKLADRAYDEANFSGKGYKILRKNKKNGIDYNSINDFILLNKDIHPSTDIMDGTYEGDVINVVVDTIDNIIYGIVPVKTGTWTTKPTYYKNWSGIINFDRSKYSTEEGKPLENKIYKIGNNINYNKCVEGILEKYDINNGAPIKNLNILDKNELIKENTIFVIRYDYDLQGEKLTVGDNSILLFEGGSFSNGELYFSNNNMVINYNNNCIFYNITFNEYSKINKANVFYDNWFENLFKQKVIGVLPSLYLTKDYQINEEYIFVQKNPVYNNQLNINGNGYTLYVDESNFTSGVTMLAIRRIHISNLKIKCTTRDNEANIATFFNCCGAEFNNIIFDGFDRLASNWSFWGDIDVEDSYCNIINSWCTTAAFLLEGMFDRIKIIGSTVKVKEDISHYHLDVISTHAYRTKPDYTNAFIEIENSLIVGGIETTKSTNDTPEESMLHTYHHIYANNSNLSYFRAGSDVSKAYYGTTDFVVSNCTCHVAKANGIYNSINSVKYINCTFTVGNRNIYAGGPFYFQGVNEISFIDCSFYKDENVNPFTTSIFNLHDIATKMPKITLKNIFFERYLLNPTNVGCLIDIQPLNIDKNTAIQNIICENLHTNYQLNDTCNDEGLQSIISVSGFLLLKNISGKILLPISYSVISTSIFKSLKWDNYNDYCEYYKCLFPVYIYSHINSSLSDKNYTNDIYTGIYDYKIKEVRFDNFLPSNKYGII